MGRKTTAIMHVAYMFIILAVQHCHALSQAGSTAAVSAAVPLAAGPAQTAAAVSAKASSSNKLPAAAAPRWLSTRGRHIIDAATGERSKLRCGSWSGAQEAHYVPNGLWAQPRSVIAQQVTTPAHVVQVERLHNGTTTRGCACIPQPQRWHQFPAREWHHCTKKAPYLCLLLINTQAAALGLNCIRFVWSVEAVLGRNSSQQPATVPAEALKANPDLVGR